MPSSPMSLFLRVQIYKFIGEILPCREIFLSLSGTKP